MEFLQTDAAINQGNSGGPIFNMEGEVIGIVSSILTESGGFQGVGFAATANIARKLLIEERNFWLGLEGFFLTGAMAELFNVPQAGAILVQKVATQSPAGGMGIRGGAYRAEIEGQDILLGGDIILAFNGVKLDCENGLTEGRKQLARLRQKAPYTISIYRAGKVVELQAVVP
jgi:S1-C subfamily serine protease